MAIEDYGIQMPRRKRGPDFDTRWTFITENFNFASLFLLMFMTLVILKLLQNFGFFDTVKIGSALSIILIGVIVALLIKLFSRLRWMKEAAGQNMALLLFYAILVIVGVIILIVKAPNLMPDLYQAIVSP